MLDVPNVSYENESEHVRLMCHACHASLSIKMLHEPNENQKNAVFNLHSISNHMKRIDIHWFFINLFILANICVWHWLEEVLLATNKKSIAQHTQKTVVCHSLHYRKILTKILQKTTKKENLNWEMVSKLNWIIIEFLRCHWHCSIKWFKAKYLANGTTPENMNAAHALIFDPIIYNTLAYNRLLSCFFPDSFLPICFVNEIICFFIRFRLFHRFPKR